MRTLIAILGVVLVGCGCGKAEPPTTIEIESKFCSSVSTGMKGERQWDECVMIGKMPCGSVIHHKKATEELTTTCRFNTWRDVP